MDTVGKWIASYLKQRDIDTLFTLTGGHIFPLLDGSLDADDSRGRHAPRAGRRLRRRGLGTPDRPPRRLRRHRRSRLLERDQRPRPRLGHPESHTVPRRCESDRRGRQGRTPGARAAPRRRSVRGLREDSAADRPHSPVHGSGISTHAGADPGAGIPGDPPGRSLQAPRRGCTAGLRPAPDAAVRRRPPRHRASRRHAPPGGATHRRGRGRRLLVRRGVCAGSSSPSRRRCPSSRGMRRVDSCPTPTHSATGDHPASVSSSRTWCW